MSELTDMPMRTWFFILVLLPSSIAHAALRDYKLDLDKPLRVLELPRTIPLPNRVDIYLTGPRKYIDDTDTPYRLTRKSPQLSITNATEVDALMSLLQSNDNRGRITNVMMRVGYTYHLLLYYDSSKTLMHFRVFETSEFVTPWRAVYPRNTSGFLYFNDKIGPWLNARVKLPTNAVSGASGTSSNTSANRSKQR